VRRKDVHPTSLILLVVVLVLLFGGRGYYGGEGLSDILGLLVIIIIIVFLFGGWAVAVTSVADRIGDIHPPSKPPARAANQFHREPSPAPLA
jgi:amino acid transporter